MSIQRLYFVKDCSEGDVDGLQVRINRGEDVESTDLQGNTGMHVAAAVSAIAVMNFLLENKADKEARNRNVRRPSQAGKKHPWEIYNTFRTCNTFSTVLRSPPPAFNA